MLTQPTRRLAHVQYGCEHIQLLLENARSSTLKQYRAILQKIFEEPSIITQTYKGPDGEPVVTLEPIYLCLQCPLIAPDYERDQHIDNKGHIFCACLPASVVIVC
jgi:ubiquitin carboxyl-terminal hydrolase 22/27/51